MPCSLAFYPAPPANVSGAGTDADVYVQLNGDKASFGPYTLPASKEAFETGSTDTFSLTTPELGRIQTLTIGHNNKGFGAAWCLSRVELENMNTGGSGLGVTEIKPTALESRGCFAVPCGCGHACSWAVCLGMRGRRGVCHICLKS